jgi:hypothetical protein
MKSILSRRNAVLGWVALTVGKRILKRKARTVVPAVDRQTRKPNKSAIALLVAGAVGVTTFLRSRSGGDDVAP